MVVKNARSLLSTPTKSHPFLFSFAAAVVLLLSTTCTPTIAAVRVRETTTFNSNSPNDWYKRYPAYPPYCSVPSEMEKRKIPAVQFDPRVGESRLLHVTAVIRHGARTPFSSEEVCWEGYHEDPATGVWNCNLTTVIAPPSPKAVKQEEGDDGIVDNNEAMFLFEKHYDALADPSNGLSNELNGTCQLGQLLLRGYEQELTNGRLLRDAYIVDSAQSYDHNIAMRLFEQNDNQGDVWRESNLFYRADDDQRTLMSGQVLLRGLLGPEIEAYFKAKHKYPVLPLHTADRSMDVMDPNTDICPRLYEIRERYHRSAAWQAFTESREANKLRDFKREVLKVDPEEMEITDCLMTTICTDRTLPDAINDYTGELTGRNRDLARSLHPDHDHDTGRTASTGSGSHNNNHNIDRKKLENEYGKNLFYRLHKFDAQSEEMLFRQNDAEYSKLSMGPLWSEIKDNLASFTTGYNRRRLLQEQQFRSKLSIFSGHDTTIMPLLAALGEDVWDGKWPPYASMVLIELHEVNIDGRTDRSIYKSNYAFRLVYNGKVLTDKLKGCPAGAELCDAMVLFGTIEPFAKRERDCQRQHEEPVFFRGIFSHAQEILSSPRGIFSLLCIVVGSAVFGSLATYLYLTGGRMRRGGRAFGCNSQHAAVDQDDMDNEYDMIAKNSCNGIQLVQSYSDTPGLDDSVFVIDDDDDDEIVGNGGTNRGLT